MRKEVLSNIRFVRAASQGPHCHSFSPNTNDLLTKVGYPANTSASAGNGAGITVSSRCDGVTPGIRGSPFVRVDKREADRPLGSHLHAHAYAFRGERRVLKDLIVYFLRRFAVHPPRQDLYAAARQEDSFPRPAWRGAAAACSLRRLPPGPRIRAREAARERPAPGSPGPWLARLRRRALRQIAFWGPCSDTVLSTRPAPGPA